MQPTSGCGIVPLSPERQLNPFVSKGTVSLSKDGEQVPITILRDNGATQTLIVEGTLPCQGKRILVLPCSSKELDLLQ